MENQQGTSWVLNVIIDDKNVDKQLEELEKRLKDIAKLDFTSVTKDIDSLISSLRTADDIAQTTARSFLELQKAISGVSDINVTGATQTAAPTAIATAMPVAPPIEVKAKISSQATSDVKTGIRNLAVEASKQLKSLDEYFNIKPRLIVDVDRKEVEGSLQEFASGLGENFGEMFGKKSIDSVGKALGAMFKLIEAKKNEMKALRLPEETAKQYEEAINKGIPKIIESIGKLNLSKFIEDALSKGMDLSHLERLISASCKSGFLNADYKDVFSNVRITIASGSKKGIEQGLNAVNYTSFIQKAEAYAAVAEKRGLQKGIETANLSSLVKKIETPVVQGVNAAKPEVSQALASAIQNSTVLNAIKNVFGINIKREVEEAFSNSSGPDELKKKIGGIADEVKSALIGIGLDPKDSSKYAANLKTQTTKAIKKGADDSEIVNILTKQIQNIAAKVNIQFPGKADLEIQLNKIKPDLLVGIKIDEDEAQRVQKVINEFFDAGMEPQRFNDVLQVIERLVKEKGEFTADTGKTFVDNLLVKLQEVEAAIQQIARASGASATIQQAIGNALQFGMVADKKLGWRAALPSEASIAKEAHSLEIAIMAAMMEVGETTGKAAKQYLYDSRTAAFASESFKKFASDTINNANPEEINTDKFWNDFAKKVGNDYKDSIKGGLKIGTSALFTTLRKMFRDNPDFKAMLDVNLDVDKFVQLTKQVKQEKVKLEDPVEIKVEVSQLKSAKAELEKLQQDMKLLNKESSQTDIEAYARRWYNFTQEIKDSTKYANDLDKSMQSLGKTMGSAFNATVGQKLGDYSKQFKAQEAAANRLTSSFVGAQKGLKGFVTAGNALKALKMGVSVGSMATGFGFLGIAVNELINILAHLNGVATNTTKIPLASWANGAAGGMNAASGAAGNASSKLSGLGNVLSSARTGMDKIAAGAVGFVTAMDKLGSTFQGISMSGMGLTFVGQGIMTYLQQIMGASSSVDKTLSDTATILGDNPTQIENAYAKANVELNKLANVYPVIREEIAKTMKESAAIGRPQEEGAFLTQQALMSGIATGGGSPLDTIKLLDAALNTYGGTMQEAAHYNDLFTSVANQTKLTLSDLATVLNHAIGVGASMKLPVDDLMEYVIIATKAGVATETVGTSFKSTMLHLAKGNNKALQDFINRYGLAIPENAKGLNEFTNQYGEVVNRIKGYNQQILQIQASGMDKKSKSKQISSLNDQITKEEAGLKLLENQYAGTRKSAAEYFNKVVAEAARAYQAGEITQEQYSAMFETTDIQAMMGYGNYVIANPKETEEIRKQLSLTKDLTKLKYEGASRLPVNQMQIAANQVEEVKQMLYKGIQEQQLLFMQMLAQYIPELKEMVSIIVTELSRLGEKARDVLGPFLKWFSSLDDGTKAFLINKTVLLGLMSIIGGPLMIYVGALGSAFNMFAQTILGTSKFVYGLTGRLLDLANSKLLGGAGSILPGAKLMDKFRLSIDLLRISAGNKLGNSGFIQDLLVTARSKDMKSFGKNLIDSLRNSKTAAYNTFIPMAGWIKDAGSKLWGLGQSAKGLNMGSLAGVLGGARTALQGLVAFIPMAIAGFGTLTIAALPYIAVIIAIIGAVYLLYRAWNDNAGGIQDITKNAFGAVVDFLKGAYDFIMSIIAPIIHVIDTIGTYFVKIFDAIKGGKWDQVAGIAKEMSDRLMEIFMTALYSIGETIYKTISGFFAQTGNFVDGGGLEAIGGTIVGFLGALIVTVMTTIGTILYTFYGQIIPTIVREGMKIMGGFLLGAFEWITNGVSDILTGISRFVRDTFLNIAGMVINLPLVPENTKKSFDSFRKSLEGVDKAEDKIRKYNLNWNFGRVKTGGEQMAKDFDAGFNALFGIKVPTKEAIDKGKVYTQNIKKGMENEAKVAVDTTTGFFSGLTTMGQVNPFSAAEASSANINSNINSAMASMQNQYAWGLDSAMQAIPSVVPQVQPNIDKLQWSAGQIPAVDQYASGIPAMSGNTYTFNIENLNVGSIEEAQQFVLNPPGAKEPPVVNMGVNAGI